MINLAGRDVVHGWGKFIFTGLGLGLLVGVTLSMAGIYRGLVDDGKVLLQNGGADLWVVQRDTLGPYAEPSNVRDDAYRALLGVRGVAEAGNVTYLTMQIAHQRGDVRVMLVGFEPGHPGEPGYLVAGRPITRSHYEAIADVKTGLRLDDRIRIRRHEYRPAVILRSLQHSAQLCKPALRQVNLTDDRDFGRIVACRCPGDPKAPAGATPYRRHPCRPSR